MINLYKFVSTSCDWSCVETTFYRINFSLCWITLHENDRKRLQLFYARRGETSRDLTYHIKARHGNCLHHPTCVVFKCVVAWKTARFHDRKSLQNTLHIPETIPSRTETRKKMNSRRLIFLVSILKIGVITSSTTQWSSFTVLLTLLYWCGRRCKIERCTMFSRLPWKQATKNFLRR